MSASGGAASPGAPVGRMPLVRVFLRSLLIQGSWNYRTMIGGGFAFAVLPALQHIHRGDREALERALARHSELFNAHPYLAGVALGATARLEGDGAPPDQVARLKAAVRGPLGALGDSLVWLAWLPTTLLAGLVLAWMELPGWIVVGAFLVVYNAGHLILRGWALRTGFREGHHVGRRLMTSGLAEGADVVIRVGTVLLGILFGVLLSSENALASDGLTWPALAVVACAIGVLGGERVWRPAAVVVVGVVALILVAQVAS